MSKRNATVVKLSLALLIVVMVGSVSWRGESAAAPQDLPAGKGAELARAKCVACHEADLIVSQRLSRLGWTREVEKMMRWGTSLTEAEKEMLIDYFAAHFGPHPTPLATMTNEARGKQIFETRCLTCHEADLTEQQRLSCPGWTREVEKMVRWGAVVSEAEKEPLLDYLVKSFGARPLAARK